MTSAANTPEATIGVISDTHGYLHPAVADVFRGAARIVHAGDIGQSGVLRALGRIAPVTAVRGNMDAGPWAASLPAVAMVELESLRICVLHDRNSLDLDPLQAGISVVISGHTHQPQLVREDGVLFLNPGSASHPRRRQHPTVALLEMIDARLSARFVELKPETSRRSI